MTVRRFDVVRGGGDEVRGGGGEVRGGDEQRREPGRRGGQPRRFVALEDSIGLCRVVVREVVPVVARFDSRLADQMRRAVIGVPLSLGEGSTARGKNRPAKFQIALGELREAHTAVRVAEACGYVELSQVEAVLREMDRLAGVLWVLIHRPRG